MQASARFTPCALYTCNRTCLCLAASEMGGVELAGRLEAPAPRARPAGRGGPTASALRVGSPPVRSGRLGRLQGREELCSNFGVGIADLLHIMSITIHEYLGRNSVENPWWSAGEKDGKSLA